MEAPLPILITNPHCSGEIPEEIFARMLECGESETDLRKRIFSEGDPFTDLLYDLPVTSILRAPYSRFAVDLNRGREEGGPDGVIKSVDFQLRPFYASDYRISAADRERRLIAYYDPWHQSIDEVLNRGGIRFLLDGHSMSAQGPIMGPDLEKPRPALCLGNLGDVNGEPVDGQIVSLNPDIARAVRDYANEIVGKAFPNWDRSNLVLLNQPFDGGYVVEQYTRPPSPHPVPGLLFEINRALYLNEDTVEPIPGSIAIWQGIILEIARFILTQLP